MLRDAIQGLAFYGNDKTTEQHSDGRRFLVCIYVMSVFIEKQMCVI